VKSPKQVLSEWAVARDARDGIVTFGRRGDLFFVTAVALGLPWLAAVVVPFLAPLVPLIDPRHYWFLQTAHQLSSFALTIGVMKAVSRRPLRDWGLNLRNPKAGVVLALFFVAVTAVPTFLLVETAPRPTVAISVPEIVAVLLTHFLIIGFTQEVLFRGFVMTFLRRQWPGELRIARLEVPVAGILATVIFVLAHVKLSPPWIWPAQLGFAAGYGLFYAVAFHRTGSLLGPSLAHGWSNAAYVAMLLVKYAFGSGAA
jgi:membrane protease YdiL (CAAX protease family)